MTTAPEEPTSPTELRPLSASEGLGVFVTAPVAGGALLLTMPGERVPRPDRFSLQLGPGEHLRGSGSMADELRHACEPNARVETAGAPPVRIYALRDLAAGEEITIDYCATEEVLSNPFRCGCGSPTCYGEIRGFRFLDAGQRDRLGWASPWLLREYDRVG